MSSNLNFWITAWSPVNAAFLTANSVILFGATMLDRQVPDPKDFDHA